MFVPLLDPSRYQPTDRMTVALVPAGLTGPERVEQGLILGLPPRPDERRRPVAVQMDRLSRLNG